MRKDPASNKQPDRRSLHKAMRTVRDFQLDCHRLASSTGGSSGIEPPIRLIEVAGGTLAVDLAEPYEEIDVRVVATMEEIQVGLTMDFELLVKL